MASIGGAAVALGVWYQSIGAAAALVDKWVIEDRAGNRCVTSQVVPIEGLRQLLPEQFDMDAVVSDPGGVEFIQFKVSAQEPPPDFGVKEVYEIFQNATRAIVSHQMKSRQGISRFVVATNRPGERSLAKLHAAVKEAVKLIQDRVRCGVPNFLEAFKKAKAPEDLFPEPRSAKGQRAPGRTKMKDSGLQHKARSMHDLANRILLGQANKWRIDPDTCVTACLKAIIGFAFVRVHSEEFEAALYNWFHDYGILDSEADSFVDNIVGQLLRASKDRTPRDPSSIIRSALRSPKAEPITPEAVSVAAINDLRCMCEDSPTPCLSDKPGPVDWMLDRSDVLCGLPYGYGQDPPGRSSQIFMLVGDGGVGKSSLLAQLFYGIAGGLSEWRTDEGLREGSFTGYPIILEPAKDWSPGIGGKIRTWGRRNAPPDRPVERFATASRLTESGPVVWVGFDGIDEMPPQDLDLFAKEIANFADSDPGVRFVLTSRREQFDMIISRPSLRKVVCRLLVEEFTQDQAWHAVSKATNGEIELGAESIPYPLAGRREGLTEAVSQGQPDPFAESIKQPVFVGVLRHFYESQQASKIREAYYGSEEAWKLIVTEYIYRCCERIHRRLKEPHARREKIFSAIKQISKEARPPSGSTSSAWENVCRHNLDGHVKWNHFYEQCAASGLIRKTQLGSFEWRNPYVAIFLPSMTENAKWQ
jgi:hypothetical protein